MDQVMRRCGGIASLGRLATSWGCAWLLGGLPVGIVLAAGEAGGRGQLTHGTVALHKATLAAPIRIGNVRYANAEVRVSGRFPELLVGAHALQDAVLMIDQRSQRMALCR